MMIATLIASIRSEWLKQKRSLTVWLVLGGGLLIPGLILAIRILRPAGLPELYRAAGFWERLSTQMWESMSVFIMPLVIILCASLIAQLEYRNNTWKQVHATPQPLAAIFVSKLVVILSMVALLFVCFNAGIYLSGIGPAIVFSAVDAPASPIPYALFFKQNAVVVRRLAADRRTAVPARAQVQELHGADGRRDGDLDPLHRRAALGIQLHPPVFARGDRLHGGRPTRVSHALPATTRTLAAAWFVGADGGWVRALRDAQRSRLTRRCSRRTSHVARDRRSVIPSGRCF